MTPTDHMSTFEDYYRAQYYPGSCRGPFWMSLNRTTQDCHLFGALDVTDTLSGAGAYASQTPFTATGYVVRVSYIHHETLWDTGRVQSLT